MPGDNNTKRQQCQAPPVVAAAKARLSGQRRWKAAATCFGGFFLTTFRHSVELQQPLSHIWRNKLPGRARNGKRQLTQALLQQQGCHGKRIIWQHRVNAAGKRKSNNQPGGIDSGSNSIGSHGNFGSTAMQSSEPGVQLQASNPRRGE